MKMIPLRFVVISSGFLIGCASTDYQALESSAPIVGQDNSVRAKLSTDRSAMFEGILMVNLKRRSMLAVRSLRIGVATLKRKSKKAKGIAATQLSESDGTGLSARVAST
jgi:hypothetical protein